jgi:hypothetical protein
LFADGETRGAQAQIGPWWAQKRDASVRDGPLRDSHGLAVANRQCRFERSVNDVTVKFKEVVLRVQAPPGQSLARGVDPHCRDHKVQRIEPIPR